MHVLTYLNIEKEQSGFISLLFSFFHSRADVEYPERAESISSRAKSDTVIRESVGGNLMPFGALVSKGEHNPQTCV